MSSTVRHTRQRSLSAKSPFRRMVVRSDLSPLPFPLPLSTNLLIYRPAPVQGSDDLFSSGSEVEEEEGGSEAGDRLGSMAEGPRGVDFSSVRRAYQPEDEETRSRFTEYSMTSSILPRSEKLQLHDDRFEQFYAQYDDEKMGALDGLDGSEEELEAGAGNREVSDFQGVFDEFIDAHTNARGVFFGKIPQDQKDR